MVAVEVATGWSALTAAYDIVKGLKNIDDKVRLNDAIITLQEKILVAQEGASASRRQLEELERELDARTEWEAIASRYKLRDFGSNTFAYQFTRIEGDDTPEHLACPNCFVQGKRSILQQYSKGSGDRFYMKCPMCEKQFGLGTSGPPKPRPIYRRRSDWMA